jgi:cation diffusion facilitator family transporter
VNNYQAVRRVLWITMGLNLVATFAKLGVGYWTDALSLIADGLDSVFDAATNVVGLVGIYFASRPADEDHPYGHRKAETMTAMVIALLLFLTTWELLKSALARLHDPSLIEAEVNIWSFVALMVSIIVHIGVSIYELRAGRRLRSDILVADALHTKADIFVSVAVIGGLLAMYLGYPLADPILALIIAVFITKIGIDIIRESSPTLMDKIVVPANRIEEIALSVPGVLSSHQVRSRGHETAVYVDLHIQVDPTLSNEEAHTIAHKVQSRLRDLIPNIADVTVHAEPAEDSLLPQRRVEFGDRIRAFASDLNIAVHNILLYEVEGACDVEFHAEVDGTLSLYTAHAMITKLEERIKQEITSLSDIIIHIEPRGQAINISADSRREQDVLTTVNEVVGEVFQSGTCHHIQTRHYNTGWAVSMHCTLPGEISLREAHRISSRLELALRQSLPGLGRVIIHTEPETSQKKENYWTREPGC